MNVVPCTTWVRRGVAAAVPEKVELTPQELEKIIKETQLELQDEGSDSEQDNEQDTITKKEKEISNNSSEKDEYNFENYDQESDNIHCNIGNIATFGTDGKDPLVTGDDNDSEKEDDILKSDDNLVLIGHVEGDASILEIFVYNEAEGSFYCHHDILLPSFPLCVEWLNYDPSDSKPGNLCAIGNMTPIIEVWDLDIIDCLEPAYKLGCKPSKKKKRKRVGHKDAVLDLAWNENYSHILASGSVDQTVLLWDLESGTPANKLTSFEEKVQSLQWHPTDTHQLLTGCADKVVRLFDCRQETIMKNWKLSGEVERVVWNNFESNHCVASTDNGYIAYIDVRQDKPICEIVAHEKEVTGLSFSSSCPGFLVSSSNDSTVKVWDVITNEELSLVWEKKSNLGALQCLASNPDNAFVFSAGGDNKAHNFKVFDFSQVTDVYNIFKDRKQVEKVIKKNVEEMMDITEDMELFSITSKRKKSKK